MTRSKPKLRTKRRPERSGARARATSSAKRHATPRGANRRVRAREEARAQPGASPRGYGHRWRGIVRRWGLRVALTGTVSYGVLLGAAAGFDYATTSPDFAVRSLVFEPSDHVDHASMRALLDVPPSTNILALDLPELSARVAADPWVARATVGRELPSTLTVQVEEHVPVAVVLDESFYLVSADGEAFKRLEPGERGTLPVITGVSIRAQGGEGDDTERRARMRAGLAAAAAWETKARPRLSEVHVGPHREITLYTASSGTQLRFGRADLEAGLARYDAIRATLSEDADRLALVHLDHSIGANRGDRVVARFVRDEDGDRLLARANSASESPVKNEEISETGDTVDARGARARRIPRAH